MLVHTGGGQNNDFGAGAQTDFILGLVRLWCRLAQPIFVTFETKTSETGVKGMV